MNNLEEFVSSLELPFEGKLNGNEYIILLDNSDDFSTLYNVISTDEDFEVDDKSLSTGDQARFTFTDGEYELRFLANFDDDRYKLVISRR